MDTNLSTEDLARLSLNRNQLEYRPQGAQVAFAERMLAAGYFMRTARGNYRLTEAGANALARA